MILMMRRMRYSCEMVRQVGFGNASCLGVASVKLSDIQSMCFSDPDVPILSFKLVDLE